MQTLKSLTSTLRSETRYRYIQANVTVFGFQSNALEILNGKSILIVLCLRRWKEFQIRSSAHVYSTLVLVLPAEVLLLITLLKSSLFFYSHYLQYYFLSFSLTFLRVH